MNNKYVKIILVLSILVVLLLVAFACSWFKPDDSKDTDTDTGSTTDTVTEDGPILPDYPPIETETGLIPIPGDSETSAPGSGNKVNVTYSTNFTLDKSDKKISFQYANPAASTQNVLIIVKVDNVEIARSALITPGNKLTSLNVNDEALAKLVVGGYDAELVIGFYDPDTNEKAMVDTKGLITIQVQE